MFPTKNLIEAEHKLREFDFVRFTWADLHGISRTKVIPSNYVSEGLKKGITTYSACLSLGMNSELPNIKDIAEKNHPNCIAVADPDTVQPIPWAGAGKYKVGEIMCETFWNNHERMYACPRYAARKQLDELASMGYELRSAFEMEFGLVDVKTGKPVFDGPFIYTTDPVDEYEEYLFDLSKALEETGIPISAFHSEYAPGQFEYIFRPLTGIHTADAAFTFKHAAKELARRKGLQANFMAKTAYIGCGSGSHFNFSVWNKETGRNAFYDEKGEVGLSDFARFWIGGLLKHAKAISALSCPTINCFRRLHGPFAPGPIDWGLENRSAFIRTKHKGETGTYMENRLPSGACNPYLIIATTVAAGIDGVKNRIEPPKQNDPAADKFPHHFHEALKILQEDTVLKAAIGEQLISWFSDVKTQVDMVKLKDSDASKNEEKAVEAETAYYAKFA